MANSGTVTRLIQRATGEDEKALAELYERYLPLLVNVARKRLNYRALRSVEPEDIAQDSFVSFLGCMKREEKPRLVDRHALTALLTTIVSRQALNKIKEAHRQCRDEGRTIGIEGLRDYLRGKQPLPEEEAIVRDCLAVYLGRLPPELRQIAEWDRAYVDKYEIASRMEVSVRTVERHMDALRTRWATFLEEAAHEDVADMLAGASSK